MQWLSSSKKFLPVRFLLPMLIASQNLRMPVERLVHSFRMTLSFSRSTFQQADLETKHENRTIGIKRRSNNYWWSAKFTGQSWRFAPPPLHSAPLLSELWLTVPSALLKSYMKMSSAQLMNETAYLSWNDDFQIRGFYQIVFLLVSSRLSILQALLREIYLTGFDWYEEIILAKSPALLMLIDQLLER